MKPGERLLVLGVSVLAIIGVCVISLWPQPNSGQTTTQDSPPARTGNIPPLELRENPAQIKPWGGFADAVSDDALYYALDSSVPYASPPTIAQLLHELRLWTAESPFPVIGKRVGRTGDWTRSVLLSSELCEEHVQFADAFDGFLIRTRYGIRVLTASDPGMTSAYAQGHYGQLLQVLAEIGTPLETEVFADVGSKGTVRDLLADATARYSDKDEPEFNSVAFACWLRPGATWEDRFGGKHTLEELAQRMAATEVGAGTCYGGHLPYAITVMLRVNEQEQIISEIAQRDLEARLQEFSRVLTRAQREDGAWDYDWAGITFARPTSMLPSTMQMDRITCTGHHLEWIALSPPHLRPDDQVVRNAITALGDMLTNLPPKSEQSFKDILPCSHAARALCLLRNEDPFQFWQKEYNARNGAPPEASNAPESKSANGTARDTCGEY